MEFLNKYKAVLFDVGNTLVNQENPVLPINEIRPRMLPGVNETLQILKKSHKLGIVSNSNSLTADLIRSKLAEIGIADLFEVYISSFDIGVAKPSPLPMTKALEALGVNPREALYVGDLESDRIAAIAAGMDFLFTSQNLLYAFEDANRDFLSSWGRALKSPIKFSTSNREYVIEKFNGLVKPKGSLGLLEEIGAQIAEITGKQPTIDPAAIAIFVGDHGIAADDSVTPWPQNISTLISDLIVEGKAGASVIAQSADVYIEIVNVGLLIEPRNKTIRNDSISRGTKDFRLEAAMTREQLLQALEVGATTAERLVAGGSRSLAVGEVGIGNTTSSAIIIGALTNSDAELVTGRGSGISDEIYLSKTSIIGKALKSIDATADPLQILMHFGGFEIAAMVGYIIRGSTLRVPIIMDGVSTLAAALIATSIRPEIAKSLIAGHVSSEPASKIAINELGIKPILNLDLRLGEGSGALLSVPIIRTACKLLTEMGTLAEILESTKRDN